ncbi:MAG: molybdenum cofactor guanylyltransferase [Acidimicrobiia bacterium]
MILGVVLAGGASRRMGSDKAMVEVAGRSMLERVAAATSDVADQVVVAGRDGNLSGFRGIPDQVDGPVGPLAGLSAALAEAELIGAGAVLLVAVDQPFVRRATLQCLIDEFDGRAVVPESDGVRQVTCALYPAAWQEEAAAELAAGGSVQTLLDRMPVRKVTPETWRSWGEDGRSWFSVDDTTALEQGLERYGSVFE